MGICASSGETLHDTGAFSADVSGTSGSGDAAAAMLGVNSLSSNIDLHISCDNLKNKDKDIGSKSDPFAVVFIQHLQQNGQYAWEELGRTEIVMNQLTDVEFVTPIKAVYRFEESQKIQVKIYDCDVGAKNTRSSHINVNDRGHVDLLGESPVIELAEVVNGYPVAGQWSGNLGRGRGSVTIKSEEMADQNQVITMKWRGAKLSNKDGVFGKSDPFLKLARCQEIGDPLPCYKTEVIMNDLNPRWAPIKISTSALSNGDPFRQIDFAVYDYDTDGGHDLIGSARTSISELNPNKCLPLKAKNGQNAGNLMLDSFSIQTKPSFLQYIMGGCQLNFMVAVDFTGSNGHPLDPNSLHFMHPQGNDYMRAIHAVGDVIEFYDSDKAFPVWGFGGRPQAGAPVSHCFSIVPGGGEAQGVGGIIEAYQNCISTVQLSGPTIFSQVIQTAAAMARSSPQDGSKYHVLLIITDGEITDMDRTIAAICESSSLNLSILIIGVGSANFDKMDRLDGDDGHMRHPQTGQKAARDIVQFVPMRNFAGTGNSARLTKELLAELPAQVCGWMEKNGIVPSPPVPVVVAPVVAAAEVVLKE